MVELPRPRARRLRDLFAGTVPAGLGLHDGRLAPCPGTSNCVSSQASGPSRVAPLGYEGTPEAALARLKAILLSMPRVQILQEEAGYLRAEARSRILGFVDDVELAVDAQAKVVHLRSASRLGYSDFGVNRRRAEAIRARFEKPGD